MMDRICTGCGTYNPAAMKFCPACGTEANPLVTTFKAYHNAIGFLASYPNLSNNLVYPTLGLAGEAGELAEKVKKLWRNHGVMGLGHKNLTDPLEIALREGAIKEAGDCLWYLDAIARELKTTLEEIAQQNVIKLLDRRERGVIKSEGDNR